VKCASEDRPKSNPGEREGIFTSTPLQLTFFFSESLSLLSVCWTSRKDSLIGESIVPIYRCIGNCEKESEASETSDNSVDSTKIADRADLVTCTDISIQGLQPRTVCEAAVRACKSR